MSLVVNRVMDKRTSCRTAGSSAVASGTSWRAGGVDRGDMLSMLLLARDEDAGETMNDQQAFDEVLNMFIAGNETSGSR